MYASLRSYTANAFILLNFTVVALVNLPDDFQASAKKWCAETFSPAIDYRLRYADWSLRFYGHHLGIDNRWQMFGRQSRFNWRYVVQGEYSNGETTRKILLPIPPQTARSVADRLLFDGKENKIQLNLYNNEFAREAYSRYLARRYPEYDGLPIRAVVWELAHCKILPPDEAVAKQKLREDLVHVRPLNRFEIPLGNAGVIVAAAGEDR